MAVLAALALAAVPSLAADAPPPRTLRELSLEELMDLEVTSVLRRESTVGDSPAAVFVITPEMIRRSGATALPELFRLVPGMDVARIDNNKWAVSARGFNDRFAGKLLVQLDGRVLYNQLFSGVYWDAVDVPLSDVERIEVIRGPGASVWGANAVNGVINIITKNAADTQGGLLGAGGGSAGLAFGTFRYGGKGPRDLRARAYAKGLRSDEQHSPDGDPNDAWESSGAGVRLDWGEAATLDAGALRSVAAKNDIRPQAAAPFSATRPEEAISGAGHVQGRYSRTLPGGSRWTLRGGVDRFEQTSTVVRTGLRLDTYDLDFSHELDAGDRHKLVYGLGARYLDAFLGSSASDGGFLLFWPEPHPHKLDLGAFAQDQVGLVEDALSLTVGSKFERNDYTGFEAQPRASLLWTPTRRHSVWAAVSRAVRTPNLVEDQIRLRLIPTGAGAVFPRATGDKGLNSEELLAYELGARAQATQTLSTDLALFYNVYRRLRVTRTGAAQAGPAGTVFVPLTGDNGMEGIAFGGEAAATWQARPGWRLSGHYALLKLELERSAPLPGSAEAPEEHSPAHQAALRSSWDLAPAVDLDLAGRFVDSIRGFNPNGVRGVSDDVGAYAELDARLAWRPRPGLELALVGQNLLKERHAEFGTNAFIPSPTVEIRRSVSGSLTWRF
jgi:iron complex outermembrane receptor protein